MQVKRLTWASGSEIGVGTRSCNGVWIEGLAVSTSSQQLHTAALTATESPWRPLQAFTRAFGPEDKSPLRSLLEQTHGGSR